MCIWSGVARIGSRAGRAILPPIMANLTDFRDQAKASLDRLLQLKEGL
ncbi:MAG: hypothetical protein R3F34_16085 [Planctomycetota bacterium]